MKKTSFSASSFFLGINRFIGRLIGVVTIVIIGHYDATLLAAFMLLMTAMTIFFMAAITGQLPLQSEFARLKAQKANPTELLIGSILLFGGMGGFMCLGAWLIGAEYFIDGTGFVFENARRAFSILILAIPLLSVNYVFAMFLEGNGYASTVTKIKCTQLFFAIALLLCMMAFSFLNLVTFSVCYILSDLVGLSLAIFSVWQKKLVFLSNIHLKNFQQVFKPFKIGLPTAICQATTHFAIFQLTSLSVLFGVPFSGAMTTALMLNYLIQVPITGISQQTGLELAHQHALKKTVWPIIKKGVIPILLITLISMLTLFVFRSQFGALLMKASDASVIFQETIVSVIFYIIVGVALLFLLNLLRACADYLASQLLATFVGPLAFLIFVTFFIPQNFANLLNIFTAFTALSCLALYARLKYLCQHAKLTTRATR